MLNPDPQTFAFTQCLTSRGKQPLLADLYRPEGEGPFDLVVWMFSGGFRTGARDKAVHRRIAAAFTGQGYAIAFIDYRLARMGAVLKRASMAAEPALLAQAEAAGEEMNPSFIGARALAVVEDCCAFLNHARRNAAALKLSGRFLLGGSSVGGMSVLNVLYLSQRLGLRRPDIATAFVMSGGFPYSASLAPTGTRILALHNPEDSRMPASSIHRFVATTPDPVVLIDTDAQTHGALTVHPDEPLDRAVARLVTFDRLADPMDFQFEPWREGVAEGHWQPEDRVAVADWADAEGEPEPEPDAVDDAWDGDWDTEEPWLQEPDLSPEAVFGWHPGLAAPLPNAAAFVRAGA